VKGEKRKQIALLYLLRIPTEGKYNVRDGFLILPRGSLERGEKKGLVPILFFRFISLEDGGEKMRRTKGEEWGKEKRAKALSINMEEEGGRGS